MKGSVTARNPTTTSNNEAAEKKVKEADEDSSGKATPSQTPQTITMSSDNDAPTARLKSSDSLLNSITWNMTRAEMDEVVARQYNTIRSSPIVVKSRTKGKPFCNYNKYLEMAKETEGTDWYLYNDGAPYVSKWEEMRKKDKGDPEKIMDPRGFRRFFGKQSAWDMPDKHGVRNSGIYEGHIDEAGLLVGRHNNEFRNEKWVDKRGWRMIGHRKGPYWARRNAKYLRGFHNNVTSGTTASDYGAFHPSAESE